MFAELGRKADAAVTRGTDAAHEAVHATALHVRRIGGAVSVALRKVTGEARDLVWNYRDVAADLRRSDPADLRRSDSTDLRRSDSTDLRRSAPARAEDPSDEPAPDGGRPTLRVVGSQD
ncbi:hypothetical protein DVS77_05565 [Mycolicibacterium moriokaense]|nr:hypothetical protein DVS77_05565 [Mycolicibacterium moriokaense]